ncbi:hypothetical protein ACTIVE_8895 [Actinomadura verrucosospora]|uniref:Uncharacterized protein n=1 Tax=Actinomadura verrucosospora TaxID=46165 RepID=A0A7D3ZVD1_ACTVE|nr:hypothetical protein ACTIVE_8895 [Actinomadura verrucosospora]
MAGQRRSIVDLARSAGAGHEQPHPIGRSGRPPIAALRTFSATDAPRAVGRLEPCSDPARQREAGRTPQTDRVRPVAIFQMPAAGTRRQVGPDRRPAATERFAPDRTDRPRSKSGISSVRGKQLDQRVPSVYVRHFRRNEIQRNLATRDAPGLQEQC